MATRTHSATKKRTWRDVLRYAPASRSTVRKFYAEYRREHGIPERCDNPSCTFYTNQLRWNGARLPLVLDHIDGVSKDNRPTKLRYLCPNCEAQLLTRGGRNKGRVQLSSGGHAIKAPDGKRHYTLIAEGGTLIARAAAAGLKKAPK
jgi:hypothetical protein